MVLSTAGVVTYATADQPAPADGRGGAEREPTIRTVKLHSESGGRKGLERRTTGRFSAVLVTWDDPEAKAKGTPEVRTRDLESGDWSPWQPLDTEPNQADGAEGERAAARGGTGSLWTGDSDGIEVRVVTADGEEAGGQPAGMDVKLLDPGTDPEGGPEPAAYAADATDPATPPATDQGTVPPTADEPSAPEPTGVSDTPATPEVPATPESPAITQTPPVTSAPPSPTPSPTPTVPAPAPRRWSSRPSSPRPSGAPPRSTTARRATARRSTPPSSTTPAWTATTPCPCAPVPGPAAPIRGAHPVVAA
ncbi:hypothetical protein SFUMM280S_03567 [Streptomyces fumanus]